VTPPATLGEIIDGIVERIWDAGAQAAFNYAGTDAPSDRTGEKWHNSRRDSIFRYQTMARSEIRTALESVLVAAARQAGVPVQERRSGEVRRVG